MRTISTEFFLERSGIQRLNGPSGLILRRAILHPITLDTVLRFRGSLCSTKTLPTRDIQVPEFKILGPACDGPRDDYKERQGEGAH